MLRVFDRSWSEALGDILGVALSPFGATPPTATTARVLSSGRRVAVLYSGLQETSGTWVFAYRTSLPVAKHHDLEPEVEEVWADVQGEAEASGAVRATLTPHEFEHEFRLLSWPPVFVTCHSIDFSFEKDGAGAWVKVGCWRETCWCNQPGDRERPPNEGMNQTGR